MVRDLARATGYGHADVIVARGVIGVLVVSTLACQVTSLLNATPCDDLVRKLLLVDNVAGGVVG